MRCAFSPTLLVQKQNNQELLMLLMATAFGKNLVKMHQNMVLGTKGVT
jgi:hypothetical protein